MGLVSKAVIGVVGVGLTAGAAASLGGFDNTSRDDAGQIVQAGDISVFSLQVGDCLNFPDPNATQLKESSGVPCSQAHGYEVFDETTITDLTTYNKEAIRRKAKDFCTASFRTFVGIPVGRSTLTISWLVPLQESWGEGDNEITCILKRRDGLPMTMSMRGTGI